MKASKCKSKKISAIIIAIVALSIFIPWQNNDIVISNYKYSNAKIPAEFDGFKIVHISDLHNKEFGKNQIKLLKEVKSISPDIIVITGDLIDMFKYDLEKAMVFVRGAVKLAPVYYVSGNHESGSGEYAQIKTGLTDSGVIVIDNSIEQLTRDNSKINIVGIADPSFSSSDYENENSRYNLKLKELSQGSDFKILLSHRPELFDLYVKNGYDLIFSGHAHGGQFRLPFIGGLVAPDQGIFPKYSSGEHIDSESTMYISKGLGNSIMPVRIFNRPEIVVVEFSVPS